MKILLILGLCLAAVSADDRCAWGESYWCNSIEAAKECGAFRHCMTTVWRNQKLTEDSTEICTYCETIIQDVKDYISNKQTQAEIQQFLESACSIIPDSQMSTECKQTIDSYLPEILDMIAADMDPQVVCSLMGLCTGLEDTVNHRPVIHRVPLVKTPLVTLTDVPICADCKKFMGDIQSMVTSATTEQQVEDYLEQNLCAQLGSMADECKALVEMYVPTVMDLLKQEFDPAMICEAMGFCNQSSLYTKTLLAKLTLQKSKLYKSAMLVSGAEECEVCKTVITELQAMEKDKATQKEMEDFVENEICSRLGALKGACDEAVETYGPELFMLLAAELDPDTFCAAIGLCSGKIVSNKLPSLPMLMKQAPPPKKLKASTTCVLCEFVMNEVDEMLGDNRTEEAIVAALDKVCSVLPSTIGAECTNFVNTYGPGILTLLEQELSPQLVCSTLGLCSSTTLKFVPRKVADTEMCGVCETLIQYVDSLLTQNATEKEIEDVLEKVCNFLPGTMKTQCDQIVDTYLPLLVKLIPQFADPREVCTEIGLCGNTSKKVVMEKIVPAKPMLVGVNECTYGPAYWCASVENARKCQAEAHCQRHVWNN